MDKTQEKVEQPVAQAEAAAAVEAEKVEKAVEKADEKQVEEKKDAEQAPSKPAEDKKDAEPAEQVKTEAPGAATAQDKTEESAPADNRPEYLTKHAGLTQLFDRLPAILEATGHNEMWGVTLKDTEDIPTVNIMIKFLRANEGNVKAAEEQLTKALEWRKEMKPLEIVKNMKFSAKKFKNLGFITTYGVGEAKSVFTWNIYGAVKNIDETFGDLKGFIKWRVALMELAIHELNLDKAKTVIPAIGEDPYQMFQVHDYQNVSFLRMSPTIRNASRETITVFSMAYPELLREKFFVNVPTVMGWVFTALKVFLSKNTIRKFHPITNGSALAREFGEAGAEFPKSYGGKNAELAESSMTVALIDDISQERETKAEPKTETGAETKAETKAEEPKAKEAPETKPEEAKTETPTAPVPENTISEATDKPAGEANGAPKVAGETVPAPAPAAAPAN
ncbi:CRAL/TRIO domain protein [Trichophyton verrucosum HKI 0517]|uniref:Phosphatidylinositol transfer protein SFH5 n=1 Tax=Trichophyton verrucosum (strain HKI 0517) TaxID=663202 RepID=D4DE99_TRIVH|nr:CRAL/TRIO domain protein [Trichophyton verrucosum HKI 0517]EFE39828.1 CRAL/TRIO domain protein [Trichophyton verrucosum HKI 0517]